MEDEPLSSDERLSADEGDDAATSAALGESVPWGARRYPFSFHGNGTEYFQIWIVNVALTLVTLGLYTPWAGVRTRRYFYGNTHLNDRNFTYLANPLALLKGFLIVFGGLIFYEVSLQFLPRAAGVILLIFLGTFPWLIYISRFDSNAITPLTVMFG